MQCSLRFMSGIADELEEARRWRLNVAFGRLLVQRMEPQQRVVVRMRGQATRCMRRTNEGVLEPGYPDTLRRAGQYSLHCAKRTGAELPEGGCSWMREARNAS